jgi:hypothetical protein
MKMRTEFWVDHVAAAKLEAISGSAYAKRHGLSVAALYYWQRKLKAPTATASASKAGTFVALRVADSAVAQLPVGCTVVMDPGLRIEMATLPAPEWLANLGRAVQEVR